MAGQIVARRAEPAGHYAWSRDVAFERMETAFAAAARRTGIVERSYNIAGRHVRAIFAGPALLPTIEPALAHLIETTRDTHDLTVRLWDTASTAVDVPAAPPARPDADDERGADAAHSRVRSSFHIVPQILTLYDPVQRKGVYWVPDAGAVPSNEIASPLRTLLHWWARDEGLQFLHAGAVAFGGQALLIGGPAGAGKSTTSLACLLAGLDYLGDDYVLVDARSGTSVYSLYSAAKLQPSQVAAFPELRRSLTNADRLASEKALWFVQRDFPDRTPRQAAVVGVLVPRVTARVETAVTSIGRGTALAAIAPSTIAQLAGADGSLAAIAGFLSRVPCFRLDAGTDLAQLAATVRGLLVRDEQSGQ